MKILELMKNHQHDYTGVQPYVFEPSDEPQTHLHPYDGHLASPFPKFSIELNGKALTNQSGTFKTEVIYCEEIGVDDYLFILDHQVMDTYVVIEVTQNKMVAFKDGVKAMEQHPGTAYEQYKRMVQNYLERLRSGSWGLYNASGKAKYKNNLGQKKTYIPKDVIYISNKKHNDINKAPTPRGVQSIRWQESWEVQAHWRKISPDSLGLDRYGKRRVKGYTWICNYDKGEGAKLFKVRKVH